MTLGSYDYLQALFLLTARHSAALWLLPAFGLRSLPAPARLALALMVTAAILPPGSRVGAFPGAEPGFLLALAGEVGLGLLIGFVVTLVFGAIRGGGALTDMQLGMNSASLFDPSVQAGQTPIETLSNLLATLLFFVTNSHHQFLLGLKELAASLPAGQLPAGIPTGAVVLPLVGAMLEAALRLALPMLAITLLVDLGLALASRMVPQLQPFYLSPPIKTVVGLGVMVLSMPLWGVAVTAMFEAMPSQFLRLAAP